MGRKLPIFLSGDEPSRLLAACRSKRDRLIILLGLCEGLRVSEIAALEVEHINFDREQILVYQGKGAKDRMVPLHDQVAGELRWWIDWALTHQGDMFAALGHADGFNGARVPRWVFPSPKNSAKHLSARAIRNMVEGAAARAGIERPNGKRISPHKLRHTFATTLLAEGADIVEVRDLLGHASVATTQVYLHCDSDRLRGAIAKLPRI